MVKIQKLYLNGFRPQCRGLEFLENCAIGGSFVPKESKKGLISREA
jgi:hypothetical protein